MENRNWKIETRNWKLENRKWKAEDGNYCEHSNACKVRERLQGLGGMESRA
jgi:hypothetical protein